MPHYTPLIATIVAGLVLSFLFGALAFRLKLPPLVGYLVAGIAIGPFTPGYVADQKLANELAEIGVILLMFGVGLHFSVKDLLAVRKIAVPGALVQMIAATLLGIALAHFLGWGVGAGFVFGLALSVASTVVLLRAMQEHRLLDTDRGRIAVGWLIVEDLVMVLALVLLPALAKGSAAEGAGLAWTLLITVAKVAAFVAFMLIVGRRVVPWMLHLIAHSGSRELFRLSVLAIALGVAFGAAMLFGVSFALGAFFAGMILAESPLSQRAAEETLPLRDAFAVLFFVSVGMLFNPSIVTEAPLALLATVAIVIIGKSVAAFAIVLIFGRGKKVALTIAASLAQIGEFSFILATLGTEFKLLPEQGRDLILAAAIVSILLNPLLFTLIDRVGSKALAEGEDHAIGESAQAPTTGHIVLVGHGRVGEMVSRELLAASERLTIIENEPDKAGMPAPAERLKVVNGNAVSKDTLTRADIAHARLLFVAIPDAFEAGQVVEKTRMMNANVRIVARAHSKDEVDHLKKMGADCTFYGEQEIARRMIDEALMGV